MQELLENLEYIPNKTIPPIYTAPAADPPMPNTMSFIKRRTDVDGVPRYTVIIQPLPSTLPGLFEQGNGDKIRRSISPALTRQQIENIPVEEILDFVSYQELESFEHQEFKEAKDAEKAALDAQKKEKEESMKPAQATKSNSKYVNRPTRGRGRGRGRPRGRGGRAQPMYSRSFGPTELSREHTPEDFDEDERAHVHSSRDESPELDAHERPVLGPSIADIIASPRLAVSQTNNSGKRKASESHSNRRRSPGIAESFRTKPMRAESQQRPPQRPSSPTVVIQPSPQTKSRQNPVTAVAEAKARIDVIHIDTDSEDATYDKPHIVDLGSGGSEASSLPELPANSTSPKLQPPPGKPSSLAQAFLASRSKAPTKLVKAPQHIVLEDDDEDDSDLQLLSETKARDKSSVEPSADVRPNQFIVESILRHLEHDGELFYSVKYVGIDEDDSNDDWVTEAKLQVEVPEMLERYKEENGLSEAEDDQDDDGDDDDDEDD